MTKTHRTIYCRTANLPGLLIRVMDGMRQWSHVAGILGDGQHVVEARAFGGVQITSLSALIARSSEHVIVEREVPDKATGDLWALHSIGQGYDWLGAIGTPWHRDWQAEGRWFCSEHAEQWLCMSGLQRFRADVRGISPNTSYMAL